MTATNSTPATQAPKDIDLEPIQQRWDRHVAELLKNADITSEQREDIVKQIIQVEERLDEMGWDLDETD